MSNFLMLCGNGEFPQSHWIFIFFNLSLGGMFGCYAVSHPCDL